MPSVFRPSGPRYLGVRMLGVIPAHQDSVAGDVAGNASGDMITVIASTVDGIATGGASTGGQTITETETIIAGTASGDATVFGETLEATSSVVAGEAAVDATAQGDVLVAVASVISGTATATSFVPMPARSGYYSPPIIRHGNASGALLVVTVEILEGVADGFDAIAYDNEFLLLVA